MQPMTMTSDGHCFCPLRFCSCPQHSSHRAYCNGTYNNT